MVVRNENEVLSDVELILPQQVISECQTLDRNARSFFIAVNKHNLTSTQLTVHKLEDDSIKIRVTVLALGSIQPQDDDLDTAEQKTVCESANSPMSNSSEHNSTPVNKRKSLKGRPRVPSAVDSSRLNKHLTAVWGSKRKKSKKLASAAHGRDAGCDDIHTVAATVDDESRGNDQENEDEIKPESMASTVIILKTVTRQPDNNAAAAAAVDWNCGNEMTQWSYNNEGLVDVEMEFVDNTTAFEPPSATKASRDIAERLKARKRRFTEINNDNNDAISCELCGESVSGYTQLVQHVNKQHEDCTFVRNYLDEIKPLAATQSAVSLPCTICGRTFSGKAALSAHKYECCSKERAESKLGALRRHVKAAAGGKSDLGYSVANVKSNKKFKSIKKLQHERSHPGTADTAAASGHACKHCSKQFSARENLLKHVKRVHSLVESKSDRKSAEGKTKDKPSMSFETARDKSKTSNSSVSITSDGSSELQEFACNHCKTVFGRMTLLVTHMRYCLKANAAKS